MSIYLIAAMDLNRVIGRNNDLPWRSKVDLAFFRKMTEGQCVAMGRKTFESLPGLLKNRKHLVVSRQEPLASYTKGNEAEVRWFKSTGELVADYLCFENQDRDLWIIGGAELYREAIHWNCLDGIVLTTLLDTVPDDPTNVKFPEFDDEEFYLTDHVLIEQGETKLKIVLLLKPEHEGNVIEENFFTVCRAVKELAKTQPTLYTFK
jgi:dihydrofolate reductase